MISFDKYLEKHLRDPKFNEYYEEEKELLSVAFKLSKERKKHGLTQTAAARNARLTQQQYSRLENGENCNIITYLKACRAAGLTLEARPAPRRKIAAVG